MARSSKILEIMNVLSTAAKDMAETIPLATGSPDLTLPEAETILASCVSFLANVDALYEAIENASETGDISDEDEEISSDAADKLNELGIALQGAAFDTIRGMGANANAMLSELQNKYYTD